MRTRRLSTLVLPLAFAIAIARPTLAQESADVAEARELFREGSKLAHESRWEEARDRFARSLALKRAPITLYSLGVAQKNTGRFVDALESFRAFLLEPSSPATKPFEEPAQSAIHDLEAKVARVTIHVAPRDAGGLDVRVDGAPVPLAALEAPRLLDPGRHAIAASATSFDPATREIELSPGASETIELRLSPSKMSPPIAASAPSNAPSDSPLTEPPPAPPQRSRTVPIVLVAAGGALFATGATLGLVGVKQASEAPTNDGPEANSARTKAVVGDVVGAVGIAAAAVGVVWLASSSKEPASDAPSASFVVGPTGAWLRGRF